MKNKIYRFIIPITTIIIVFIISYLLVTKTDIEKNSIFSSSSLITYFSVLIGFSLTVYTFGLSMVTNIKTNISKLKKLNQSEKDELYQGLRNGFSQIKQDIWLIFYGIIIIIVLSILSLIENPFGWNVEDLQIPEIFYISIFILSTIAMYDIMKTLFNLAEINMELIKDND